MAKLHPVPEFRAIIPPNILVVAVLMSSRSPQDSSVSVANTIPFAVKSPSAIVTPHFLQAEIIPGMSIVL
jgi:hypothetical protein